MARETRFNRYVEILDTTLRDGEQTPGVAFTPAEKLEIARLLIGKLRVDRIEIASARVSEGERNGVVAILDWAARHDDLDRMEILGFADGGKSVEWIQECGGKVINLLAKGSLAHCRIQLGKTPRQHFDAVRADIERAVNAGLKVNVYLEDWTNGMADSFHYVHEFLGVLAGLPVERVMLPDTLGVATPGDITRWFDWVYNAYPQMKFDFHGHNDYGLVTANSLAAVQAGVSGVHTTVNGLGERTGNQPLAQLVVAVADMTDRVTRVAEKQLQHATSMVQNISGKRCAWNMPVVGADVFTQTCGVHADGDKKGNLYVNKLLPERFARRRNYALGKLSGKASIDKNLEEIGLELDPEVRRKVLLEIVRLGDKKKAVTPADLPFIIAGVLRAPFSTRVKIADYSVLTHAKHEPRAGVTVEFDGMTLHAEAAGDGGYDAFVRALRKAFRKVKCSFPRLADYEVRIPPGGKTDALVETTISWENPDGKPIVTTGVDSDQLAAAVLATEKMLNLVLASSPPCKERQV